MAKAHKNPIFVLGDDCREPSSAHLSSALPATSPAGCIWQQCARQQIAATYHATCRRGATAEHTTVHTPGQPTCRACCRNLPPRPTCRSYYRAYRCSATAGHTAVYATETYRQGTTAGTPTTGAYYLALAPAPSGRVIRM